MSELAVGVAEVKDQGGRGTSVWSWVMGKRSRALPLGGKAWLGSRGASWDSGTREAKP